MQNAKCTPQVPTVTLSPCHLVSCHLRPVTCELATCDLRPATLSPCLLISLSPCLLVTRHSSLVTVSPHHLVTLSPHHRVTGSRLPKPRQRRLRLVGPGAIA